MILSAYPYLGYDISFLKTTLHGRLPLLVMVPWFICGIALLVELNFRGFLLGRLAALESRLWRSGLAQRLSPLALITCALVFAFDPFMVNTFQHLHWIALWDGLIWGIIWLRTRNLYITIVAHAVEVIVMYSAVRIRVCRNKNWSLSTRSNAMSELGKYILYFLLVGNCQCLHLPRVSRQIVPRRLCHLSRHYRCHVILIYLNGGNDAIVSYARSLLWFVPPW